MKRIAAAVMLAALPFHLATGDTEFEIHRSEEFTSPGAGPNEELHYVRIFTVDSGIWNKQPKADPLVKPPLPAAKALELAEASLDSSTMNRLDNAHVTKLELLTRSVREPNNPTLSISFYLVTFLVDGSEIQRVVLMDGTVVKSQLTRIPAKEEKKR